jgi:hypothetical protein
MEFSSAAKSGGWIVEKTAYAIRASLREIQELGRWADLRIVQRYSNVSDRNKRSAIQNLSQLAVDEPKPEEIASRIKRPVRCTKDSASAQSITGMSFGSAAPCRKL